MDEHIKKSNDRLRQARQKLFIALDQIQYGGSQQDVVNAIEELSMALISQAFATHPKTRDAVSASPVTTDKT